MIYEKLSLFYSTSVSHIHINPITCSIAPHHTLSSTSCILSLHLFMDPLHVLADSTQVLIHFIYFTKVHILMCLYACGSKLISCICIGSHVRHISINLLHLIIVEADSTQVYTLLLIYNKGVRLDMRVQVIQVSTIYYLGQASILFHVFMVCWDHSFPHSNYMTSADSTKVYIFSLLFNKGPRLFLTLVSSP